AGGVRPVKMGGGRQTNSLRLEAKDGKQYAMRALTKDASRLLPYPLNEISFAQLVAQDVFLATHPFGALAIPPLADAAKVYHTNPNLYYIPKQPALEKYNAFFGDEVYLIEERPDDDRSDISSFGHSTDIISTPKLIDRLGNNKRHKVEQDWVVRARLFDLVIGDWDRHDDQWRWASFGGEEKDDIKTYRPIPRDRDQVFPNYDGLLVAIARFSQPILKQLSPYQENIKAIKWAVYNARHFDGSFLNELTWEDWKREAQFLQDNLSDAVIDAAFASVSDTQNKDLQFEKIAATMKKRRDNLLDFARRFYLLTAKKVDITGTNDKELFTVDRLSDSTTLVRVYHGKPDTVCYERVFYNQETEEIHLYGLEDDDQFLLNGAVEEGIIIRIIGGLGADEIIDRSVVAGSDQRTLYYDFDTEANKVKSDFGELKDLRSSNTERNIYDRKHPHYEFNFTRPLPILGFNPDEGVSLGLNLLRKIYQFKKSPYGQEHELKATYITAVNSMDFVYTGKFLSTFKDWDLITHFRGHGDRFAFNYFGLGNDSSNPVDALDFNRVRQSQILLNLGTQRRFLNDEGALSISTFFERTKIAETPDRFISSIELPADLFNERYYTGLIAQLNVSRTDQTLSPRRGLAFDFTYAFEYNLNDRQQSFGQLSTDLRLYVPLDQKMRFVLAIRVGTAINNSTTDFFNRPTLGGNTNLRGFRAERFRGDATFYHNTDIRIKLVESINRFLPLTFGISGGFDHGRVWLEVEDSNTWHYSYGGGIWIAPANLILLSGGYYRSREQGRVFVKLGHLF
ncbi:MAG: BamA/TamA family outer membrane protein, partial [Bacteroidota bacterium]